jgi:cell division protein FtsB
LDSSDQVNHAFTGIALSLWGMITRKRLRNIALALGFYALSGAAVGYFAYHAHHGERGLHAKASYKIRIAQLEAEIQSVRVEKADWERRVRLMRAESLDRDVLEERARALLNTAHKNDVIVILPKTR